MTSRATLQRLQRIKEPAVFLFGGIGDHVLAMPALRALTRAFPRRLTVVCGEGAPEFLYQELRLNRIIRVAFSMRRDNVASLAQKLSECDLSILLTPWVRPPLSGLVMAAEGAVTVGPSIFCDLMVRSTGRHIVDVGFGVAKAIVGDIDLASYSTPLRLSAGSRQKARRVLQSIPGVRKILVIHPETHRRKCWDLVKLNKVVKTFLDTHPDYGVCIVCQRSAAPLRWYGGSRVRECSGFGLEETFALVSQADLFLGVDSCMLHVADISRVPGVGLFGPTDAWRWGFRFGPGVAVQSDRVMETIRVSDVMTALYALEARSAVELLFTRAIDSHLVNTVPVSLSHSRN